jgi:Flp pilus assembly protein TadG
VPTTLKIPRPNKRLRSFLRRLATGGRDESGAAAVFFAVSLILLAPLTLGMMDVYAASTQRGRLQDALDAATLFAARSTATTTAAVDVIGDKALTANLVLPAGVTLVASNFTLSGSTVTGYAEVTPSAIAPGLWPHANINASASVQRSVDELEVALVLDNTGSMSQGGKLATLQTSAKNLIDTLVAAAATSTAQNPLKIALVPFSQSVRVQGNTATTNYDTVNHIGTGFPTAWIDPQGTAHANAGKAFDTFSTKTDRFTMLKQMNKQVWAGCVEMRMPPYDVQDDAPTMGTPATMFVPYFWPDEPSGTSYQNSYQADAGGATWLDKEQNPAKYVSKPSGGTGPNKNCDMQPLTRLGTSFTTLKSSIDAMVATGNTNIPMGLVWGWHTLSPNAPFSDGAPYATQHLRKVVVLMTDGENTNNIPIASNLNLSDYSGVGYIWQKLLGITGGTAAQRVTAMDNRLTLLCNNMKAKGVYIYTVRVEVTSGTSNVLQNCASSPDMFYDVQDVSQLNAAFQAIAGSINSLRISK